MSAASLPQSELDFHLCDTSGSLVSLWRAAPRKSALCSPPQTSGAGALTHSGPPWNSPRSKLFQRDAGIVIPANAHHCSLLCVCVCVRTLFLDRHWLKATSIKFVLIHTYSFYYTKDSHITVRHPPDLKTLSPCFDFMSE